MSKLIRCALFFRITLFYIEFRININESGINISGELDWQLFRSHFGTIEIFQHQIDAAGRNEIVSVCSADCM